MDLEAEYEGPRARSGWSDRGAASAQLVLAAPVVLLVMLLAVQVALAWHAKHIAQTAASRGLAEARADDGTQAARRAGGGPAAGGHGRQRPAHSRCGGHPHRDRSHRRRSAARSCRSSRACNFTVHGHAAGPVERSSPRRRTDMRTAHGLRGRPPRGQQGQHDGERGSATVELVLLTPALVLLALVAFAFGRVVDARILVEDAAHSAARAASLTTSAARPSRPPAGPPPTALAASGAGCADPTVQVDHDGLAPGSTVTATVTCYARLGDLSTTGLPGTLTLDAASTSPVDAHRSTP